jgi:magnesium transporter
MIRSFVFKNGKLVSQDLQPEMLRLVLYDEDVQIWVDLDSSTPEEAKSILEVVFNFHPLAIEDCLTVSELPKVDEYEGYIFLVIHAVDYSAHVFQTTECDLFIGKNFLVSYHHVPLKSMAAVIDRVTKSPAAAARAPDRLAYTILQMILENYDPALADLSKDFAALDRDVMTQQTPEFLNRVMGLQAEVQRLRQIIAPQRAVIARVAHGEFRIVRAHLLPYFRDLQDRLTRINERADGYRDSLNSLLQVHLGIQQMQANHVIKALTLLATLSMPLIVITSFYGMNLSHYPPIVNDEARTWPWWWAYVWVFGVSALLTAWIYGWLRRKRWT